jgi:DNA-binding beta-propeller fold protein YncE
MAATRVIGQTNFGPGASGAGDAKLSSPLGLAYDYSRKRLFVADNGNQRVLLFDLDAGVTNGMDASVVLGQPDFLSTSSDGGAAATFSNPFAVAFDPDSQRLFVSDKGNRRVLVFEAANPTSGADAGFVLGQPDFSTYSSGSPPAKLSSPGALDVDSIRRRLFVSNSGRVVVYDLNSLATGMNASTVIGRSAFTDFGSFASQSTITWADGLALAETAGRLFVADPSAFRILVFDVTP